VTGFCPVEDPGAATPTVEVAESASAQAEQPAADDAQIPGDVEWIFEQVTCTFTFRPCPEDCPPSTPPDNYYCELWHHARSEHLQASGANTTLAESSQASKTARGPVIEVLRDDTLCHVEGDEIIDGDLPIPVARIVASMANVVCQKGHYFVWHFPPGVYQAMCHATGFCPTPDSGFTDLR